MSSLEQAVERLERTSRELPEGQRPPELALLLRGLRQTQEAAALLRRAPALTTPWTADANPQLFKGLVNLLQGLALQSCASNSRTLCPEMADALAERLLQPVLSTEQGRVLVAAPTSPAEVRAPLIALQLLVAGTELSREEEQLPQVGLQGMLVACAALWPGHTPTPADRQRLARQYWVPPPPPAAPAASAQASPSAARQEQRAVGALAVALAAELACHTPTVSLADLHAAAVWLIGTVGRPGRILLEQHQAIVALLKCTPPASAAVGCMPLLWACRSASNAGPLRSADQLERQMEYVEAAQVAAASCNCRYAATQLALAQCEMLAQVVQLRRVPAMRWVSATAAARHMQRARQAADAVAGHLGSLKRWLPPKKLAVVKQRHRAVLRQLDEAGSAAPRPGEHALACPAAPATDRQGQQAFSASA
ncbi:hypothetical protein ABPG75_002015 [Micractinium tetrahymenae]